MWLARVRLVGATVSRCSSAVPSSRSFPAMSHAVHTFLGNPRHPCIYAMGSSGLIFDGVCLSPLRAVLPPEHRYKQQAEAYQDGY